MAKMTTLTKNGKTVKVMAGDNVDKEFRANGWTEKKESDAKTTTTPEKQETQPKTETKSTSTSGSAQTSSTTKK